MSLLLRLLLVTLLGSAVSAAAQTKSEPPVAVRTVNPVYPLQMRREGITGVVTVKCVVDVNGNVTDAEIVKSSHEAFEKPALEALQKWKFKPGRQDGVAVATRVSFPIKFVQEG